MIQHTLNPPTKAYLHVSITYIRKTNLSIKLTPKNKQNF